MGELWLGNVDESATDDEIKEFLCRYGFRLTIRFSA